MKKSITDNKVMVQVENLDQLPQIDTSKFRNMLLVPNRNGEPMMVFTTNNGYWHFPLTNAFEINICNEFLRSLDVGDIEFHSYTQYADLVFNCGLLLEERQKNDNAADIANETDDVLNGVQAMACNFMEQFDSQPLFPFTGDAESQDDRLWHLVINAIGYGFAQALETVGN